MALMLSIGTKYLPKVLNFVAKFNSKELFLFAVTGIALASGFLASWMDVSFSFGAFLAGIALSDSDYGKKAISDLMPVRDLFAMFFFVSIGMMLDCMFLFQHFKIILIVMLVTSFARSIPLAVITWIGKYRNVIPVAMFFGMLPTSEIAFVLIQMAKIDGYFNEFVYSLILCTVVCSMLLGPIADGLTSPVYSLLRRTIWKKSFVNTISITPSDCIRPVIVAGGGYIGRLIALLMKRMKQPCVLIEPTYKEYQDAVAAGVSCMFGDPQHEVLLKAAGIENATALIASSTSFRTNWEVIKTVK